MEDECVGGWRDEEIAELEMADDYGVKKSFVEIIKTTGAAAASRELQ